VAAAKWSRRRSGRQVPTQSRPKLAPAGHRMATTVNEPSTTISNVQWLASQRKGFPETPAGRPSHGSLRRCESCDAKVHVTKGDKIQKCSKRSSRASRRPWPPWLERRGPEAISAPLASASAAVGSGLVQPRSHLSRPLKGTTGPGSSGVIPPDPRTAGTMAAKLLTWCGSEALVTSATSTSPPERARPSHTWPVGGSNCC